MYYLTGAFILAATLKFLRAWVEDTKSIVIRLKNNTNPLNTVPSLQICVSNANPLVQKTMESAAIGSSLGSFYTFDHFGLFSAGGSNSTQVRANRGTRKPVLFNGSRNSVVKRKPSPLESALVPPPKMRKYVAKIGRIS